MIPPLRAASLVGNALALVLLALLCVRAVPLTALHEPPPPAFGREVPSAAAGSPERTGDADARVLLVIVDALRLDTARDARTMPTLAGLAARAAEGGHRDTFRTLRVIQPVPSTIGALPALVEGRAVPANAALLDLTPRSASGGGLLEVLHRAGHPAEVGGTALWEGLYARWLGPGRPIAGMPDPASDADVLRWGLERLDAADAPPLLIVHLGRLDAVAHRHGAGSVYRDTARDIDDDVARLLARGRAVGRDVLITSDHGVTRDGGHAGGETPVRAVPLFAPDGALDLADGAPQTRFATLLALRLGYRTWSPDAAGSPGTTTAPDKPRDVSAAGTSPSRTARIATLAFIAAVGALAWRGLSRLGPLGADRTVATFWSSALWIGVAVAVLVSTSLAAALAAGALALPLVFRPLVSPPLVFRSIGERADDADRPIREHAPDGPFPGWPLAVGVLVAAIEVVGVVSGHTWLARAALIAVLVVAVVAVIRPETGAGRRCSGSPKHGPSGTRPPGRRPPERRPSAYRPPTGALVLLATVLAASALLGGPALCGATLLAVAGARALSTRCDSAALGVVCLVALTTLAHLAGDDASLSSLDVSLAHRAAASPVGLAGAVAIALLRLFWLPGVWVVAWWHARRTRQGETLGNPLPLATVRGGAQTSLACMVAFAAASTFGWPAREVLYGAALGGLLQEAALWIGLLGTLASMVLASIVLPRRSGSDPVT